MTSTIKCLVCSAPFEPQSPSHVTCKTKCHHAYYTEEKVDEIVLDWVKKNGDLDDVTALRKAYGPVFSKFLNHAIGRLHKAERIHMSQGRWRYGKKRGPKTAVAAPKTAPVKVTAKLESAGAILALLDDTTLQLYAEARRVRAVNLEVLTVTEKEIEDLYAQIRSKTEQRDRLQKEIAEADHDLAELVKGV